MTIDRNPTFGEDINREKDARQVASMLWSSSGGNFSKIPSNYLEAMGFSYSDGTVSLLNLLDRVEFSEEKTFEEFAEVVDHLIRIDPSEWPNPDSIESIPVGKLLSEDEEEPIEFSESDWDFSDSAGMSEKMELFFKKVISSVYTDGVTAVTDKMGNPPSAQNRYLMASDGESFSGIFFDSPKGEESKKYPFKISMNSKGKWEIRY